MPPKAAAKKPAVKKPATKTPAAKRPAAKKPAAEKPAAKMATGSTLNNIKSTMTIVKPLGQPAKGNDPGSTPTVLDTNTLSKTLSKTLAPPVPLTQTTVKRQAEQDLDQSETDGAASNARRQRKTTHQPGVARHLQTTAVAKPKTGRVPRPKVVLNQTPSARMNVYVFGCNEQGELGLGPDATVRSVTRPRLHPNLLPASVGVVQIAVGTTHCAALTHDNRILTWGVNLLGALGRKTEDDDDKTDGSDDDDAEIALRLNPKEAIPGEVDPSAFPARTEFVQLAVTENATFALTNTGLVFGWGTFKVFAHASHAHMTHLHRMKS